MKLVFSVVIFVAVVQATAIDTQEEEKPFPDYWQGDDYDNFYDYDGMNNDDSKENNEKKEDDDNNFESEIQDFVGNNADQNESFSNEEFDALADYAFEDNRSNNENKGNDANDDILIEKQPVDGYKHSPDNVQIEPLQPKEDEKTSNEDKDTDMYEEWWNELTKDDSSPDLEENKESSEVQESVNEDNSENKEDSYVKPVNEGIVDPSLNQAIEDTKKNLEGNDDFDSIADDNINFNEGESAINDNDDTPEKVLEDLSDDLDKLFETLNKLSDNDSDLGENDNVAEESEEVNDIQDYEEKYTRPYGEGYIMSLRDDYDNFLNSNLTDEIADKSKLDEDIAKDYAEVESNNEQVETTKIAGQQEEAVAPISNNDKSNAEFSDEIDKLSFDDSEDNEFKEEIKKHYYGNDGLVDDDLPKNDDAEVFLTASSTKTSENEPVTVSTLIENASSAATSEGSADTTTLVAAMVDKETSTVSGKASTLNRAATKDSVTTEAIENSDLFSITSTMKVEELNSSEYNELMSRFALEHKDEIVQNSTSVGRNTAPVHITLSLDKPTIITSPNYPDPYPMDIVMDWIIDGPGMGIEFNLTDCIINGNIGDYLLVKPGSVNAEGSEGIIFSFTLKSEKRYRFTNVNRMFVRFQTHAAWFGLTGFSFSAKMIFPPPQVENEVVPEPEPIVEQPTETLEVSVAGLTLLQFHEVRSEFKELIADMAQAYIKDNNIDPGLNTTLEVTQILRTAVCNIRWPSYETCVDISFGVPLHYATPVTQSRLNTTELGEMWRTYIEEEPFASRLRSMGITEYAIPNDSSILTVWLVIASGVVIAMCLLAFALWRFSCFADYKRMKTFSDTDSIQNEKRNLDLYPTPHQTLPPLYSESDYKWADEKYDDSTRVDLGGFANKSYIRDDLFDLDSDEDVIVPHDRKTVISPRDVYDV